MFGAVNFAKIDFVADFDSHIFPYRLEGFAVRTPLHHIEGQ